MVKVYVPPYTDTVFWALE